MNYYQIYPIFLNLVNSSFRQEDYDYTPNKLEIKQSILSRLTSTENINEYNLQVSYIVSCYYLFHFINMIFVLKRFQNYMNVHY